MIKQQKHRYASLISHIALTLFATHGLIYLLGRVVSFSYALTLVSYGNVFLVDIIFLIINCIKALACLFVPLKLFEYLRRNAFVEKYLPVEHEVEPFDKIAAIFVLGLAANYILAWLNILAVDVAVSMEYLGENEEYILGSGLDHPYQIVIYIISTAVIPAIAEEYVFRKTICKSLMPYGPKTAVLVSAILFGLMHTTLHKVGFTFVGGIFLGWLYIASKDIKIPMLFHFIHNFMSCVGVIIGYKVSNEAYAIFIIIYSIILMVAGTIAFSRLKAARNEQEEVVVMLSDEEGNEVKPLSTSEKVTGFFTPLMIAFIVATIIQMIYYLSFKLV